MLRTAIEFAKLILRANEITENSFPEDSEDPTIDWEEAWIMAGGDPALVPIVVILLNNSATLPWARNVASAEAWQS